jgi:hypothetical protein
MAVVGGTLRCTLQSGELESLETYIEDCELIRNGRKILRSNKATLLFEESFEVFAIFERLKFRITLEFAKTIGRLVC